MSYFSDSYGEAASWSENSSADTMQDALRNDLLDHVYSDLTVKSFVEIVWGIDSDRAQTILDGHFDLDLPALTDYHNIVNRKNPKVSEPDLHEPFRRVSRKLLKDICEMFDLEHTSVLKTCFWDKGGVHRITRPTRDPTKFVTRKPDLLDIFIPRKADGELLDPDIAKTSDFDDTITWGEPRCVVEFKRTRRTTSNLASVAETEETKSSILWSIITGTSHHGSTSKHSKRGKKSSRGAGKHEGSSTIASSTGTIATSTHVSQSGVASGGSNASRKRPSTTLGDNDHPLKKRKINVSAAEVQLSQYALETLIPGTRYYTTGILIDCFVIKLWCYDRMASIRTVEFNFNTPEGTASLGLVLFALSQANMKQAGFDPNLYKFIPPASGAVIQAPNIVGLERPVRSIADSNVCFKFESPESKKMHIFLVQDVISSYTGIHGRGTFVAGVLSGIVGGLLSTCTYALKLSWQYTARIHEGEIIAKLREVIPHWKKHLPDPEFSLKLACADIGLPTYQIKQMLQQAGYNGDVDVSDRDLHILVTDRYKKIWEAKDVEEFKRIFLDCIECHYHAYNTGNVLHRDISENNLMIYCPDSETNVDATSGTDLSETKIPELSRGILNDFDMAAPVDPVTDPHGTIKSGTPQHHIIGTLPFMARDLLDKDRPPLKHFYRHDLESFFYLLIWAATHYDFKCHHSKLPTPCNSILEKWTNQDTAYDSKTAFRLDDLVKYRKPGWEDVWKQWIQPLFRMFRVSYFAIETASFNKEPVSDHVTCDGRITFERFMKVIGATPRGLEPQATDH